MQHTLTKGNQSNYQITVTITKEQLGDYKAKALKTLQKDVKEAGFRPGYVPLDLVEKKIKPDYLEMAIYEEILHDGTTHVLKSNEQIKFIGTIYDLNKDEKDDLISFTFKLDEYPAVDVKNDNRKKLTVATVDAEPTPAEVEDTLLNLKKQYANYTPAESITTETLFKGSIVYTNAEGIQVDKKSIFVGKEEMAEHKDLAKRFEGKKLNDIVSLPYDAKKTPEFMKTQNTEAKEMTITIMDVRTIELPEFTPENIKKFFGNDDVTSEDGLTAKISDLIKQQKEENLLMKSIDDMLMKAKEHITIAIPKTLLEEEVKTRMKSLQERMGGEKGLQEYFEKMGEEQKNKMITDISNAAKLSLEKFFLLQKLTELLAITDLNRETPLDVEKKIYATLQKTK